MSSNQRQRSVSRARVQKGSRPCTQESPTEDSVLETEALDLDHAAHHDRFPIRGPSHAGG